MTQVANHIHNDMNFLSDHHPPLFIPPTFESPTANVASQTIAFYQKEISDLKCQLQQQKTPPIKNTANHPHWQQPYSVPSFHPYNPSFVRGRGNCGGRGNGGTYHQQQGRGCGRQNRVSTQRNPTSYFWTHGGGTHWSWDCANPAPGHCWQATFENKMGGSTYCFPTAKAENKQELRQ